MEFGMTSSDQPKAFVMNQKTFDLVSATELIPVETNNKNLSTVFGIGTYLAPYLPDYIIGIMDAVYALGLTLTCAGEPSKAARIHSEISLVAVQGIFFYGNFQYYGLTNSNLPEPQRKVKLDLDTDKKEYPQTPQNQYDPNKPYANRYDLHTTMDFLTDMRKASANKHDLVYIMNQHTAQDIYETDGLPDYFINVLTQKLNDVDIVYIEYMPNGIVGLVTSSQADTLKTMFDTNVEAGRKFGAIIAFNSQPGIFHHSAGLFAKLIPLSERTDLYG
jgi:hypothetical protein